MTIKNIIFDLGNVIMDVDTTRTYAAFNDLGIDIQEVWSIKGQNEVLDDLEIGAISNPEFFQAIRDHFNSDANNEALEHAWMQMLSPIPKERLDFIYALRENGFNTFVYSNTNNVHVPHLAKLAGEGMQDYFHNAFDKIYYSSTFGKRKPHPESFLALLEDSDLNADETLFIDDTIHHVNGAREAGMQAMHLDKSKDMDIFAVKEVL